MIPKQAMSRCPKGMSLVEFMVGIAVGLFVVGGATKLFVDYVTSNKTLLLETRVNQELRVAADLVARDLRRAGYWTNATAGVWSPGSTSAVPNPHAQNGGEVTSTANSVSFTYARNGDNTLDSNEYGGFRQRLVSGVNVLEMQDGQGNWQAVTDPGTVNVTGFVVTSIAPALTNNLSSYCSCLSTLSCTNNNDPTGAIDIANPTFGVVPPLTTRGIPTLLIHSFDIVLTGQSVTDSTIQRTIRENVRVRNGRFTGYCPG